MFLTKLDSKSVHLFSMIAVVGLLATLFSATSINSSPETASATPPTLQVEAGHNFTCVLKDGGVKCVGANEQSQLGNGFIETNRSRPADVIGLSTGVTALELGAYHACAIVNGGVKCWGYNAYGQLGNGSLSNSATPVSVAGLQSGVTAISLGDHHSCAIVNGGAKCWGFNEDGQLGNGSLSNSATPVSVDGLDSGVSAIALGGLFSCAVVDGGMKCWGYNGEGELGNGSIINSSTPVSVDGLSNVDAIAAGAWHACALLSGRVECWGWGSVGQVGNGLGDDFYANSTPVPVAGLQSGVSAISLGGDTSCALIGSGVKCWGENGSGQLGDGTLVTKATPVSVQNLSNVTSISVGASHSCAIDEGDVQCWGSDSSNQRVNGTSTWYTSSSWSTPADLSFDPSLGDVDYPEIVVDSTGLATAIWSQYDGDGYVIRASTSQSGGEWSPPVLVADPGAGQYANDPKLTVDSTGLVTAVWNRFDGTMNDGPSFMLQSSTSQSGGAWTQVDNVSDPTEDAESHDLTVDSSGLVTLVWTAKGYGSFIRSSTSQSGQDWVANGILSDVNQDAYFPQVAVDGNGLVTAVWEWWSGTQDIVQSSTSQSGGTWTQVETVSDTSSDLPQVVADSSGTVTVIWANRADQGSLIQSRTKVPGDGWQSIVNLSDTEGIAGDATLEVNSSGLVAAIWTRWDNMDTEVVQVKTLELPGDWSPTFTFFQEHPGCNSDGVGDCVGTPDVIVDSAGQITAIWSLFNAGSNIVQSSFVESGSEWSTPFDLSAGVGWNQKLAVDSTGLVTAIWNYYDEIMDQDVLQASNIAHDISYSPPPPPPSSGGSNSETSTAQPLVKAAPLQKSKVKGAAKVSAVLFVAKQTWSGFPTPKLTYRWYACSKQIEVVGKKAPKACKAIKGANKRKFRLTENQAGKFVSVLVTGTSEGTASTKIFTRSTARVS